VPASSGGSGTSCLLVNPPATAVDKRVVVAVAGKRLAAMSGGQPRATVANKRVAANYLEGTNDNDNCPACYTYDVQSISATFNDFLLYQ